MSCSILMFQTKRPYITMAKDLQSHFWMYFVDKFSTSPENFILAKPVNCFRLLWTLKLHEHLNARDLN